MEGGALQVPLEVASKDQQDVTSYACFSRIGVFKERTLSPGGSEQPVRYGQCQRPILNVLPDAGPVYKDFRSIGNQGSSTRSRL